MQEQIQRLPGNTIAITIEVPWPTIKTTFDEIYAKVAQEVEVSGFRKGKAPAHVTAAHIDTSKVYEEVLKVIIPKLYSDIVQKNDIKPIITPKIELQEAQENKNWKIHIRTAQRPLIKLGNYKDVASKVRQNKKPAIWVPGKEEAKKEEKEPTLGEFLDALYKEITVELSPLIVERETNRLLSQLLDQTQKLGLTIDQYLEAQGKTHAALRADYERQAQKSLSLEFALEEIADTEKITVEDTDIQNFIQTAKTDQEKELLQKERYYVSGLLRRQKTLGKLFGQPAVKS